MRKYRLRVSYLGGSRSESIHDHTTGSRVLQRLFRAYSRSLRFSGFFRTWSRRSLRNLHVSVKNWSRTVPVSAVPSYWFWSSPHGVFTADWERQTFLNKSPTAAAAWPTHTHIHGQKHTRTHTHTWLFRILLARHRCTAFPPPYCRFICPVLILFLTLIWS